MLEIQLELLVGVEAAHDAHQPFQRRLRFHTGKDRAALGGNAGAGKIGLHLRLHGVSLRAHQIAMLRLQRAGLVQKHGDRRFQRMCEIADLHAGALDDAPVAVDQRIDFVRQRLDFAREFAFEAFRLPPLIFPSARRA